MNIRLLGSGYGECKIKKKTTRDYRKRGGLLIDDRLLIDAPSDILEVAEELGFSDLYSRVTDVVISHSHAGHFSKEAIATLAEKRKIRIFASRAVLRQLADVKNLETVEIAPFTQFNTGSHKVAVIPSNHNTDDPEEPCFNFVVMSDKNLLYMLDGGLVNRPAFNAIKQLRIACVIMECALGAEPPSEKLLYHNDVHGLGRLKGILADAKITDEKTKYIITHIPTSKKVSIHELLLPFAEEYGLTLGYDGLFATI